MTAHVWSPPAEIDATLCEAASAACDAGASEPSPAASETSTAGTTNRRTSPRPTAVLADIVAVLSADAYRAWHDANTLSNPLDTEGKKIISRSAEHVGRRHSGWAACGGSSWGRWGSTSSPEEAPRTRLLPQGAACPRAPRASIRRAASQPR